MALRIRLAAGVPGSESQLWRPSGIGIGAPPLEGGRLGWGPDPMPAPRTRYARNGDVSLAYEVAGDGPHDILLVNSWVSQMEHLWTEPRLARMFARLTSFARLVQFDRRGSGMSDRVPPAPLEEQMDDVLAVLDAAGCERPTVLAETEGTALACLFAATHPERVRSLALFAPIPRILSAPDYPWAHDPVRRESYIAYSVEHWGEGVTVDAAAPAHSGDAALRDWFGRMERLAVGPAAVEPAMRVIGETDVRDILPLIRVPTLVTRREGDHRVDRRHAEFVRDHVPGARLVELPGSESVIFLDDIEPLVDELEELVTGTRATRPPERVLATVLFTDIVGSTERASEVGDRAWRELLDAHHALVRAELAAHGGDEIKTMGDGFLATFDGPARAVRCALRVAERSGGVGVPIRAGVHTGECERVGSDVAGIAVHIAARVMGEAGAGEVVVSRTVTDLVAGSGLSLRAARAAGAPRRARRVGAVSGHLSLDLDLDAPARVEQAGDDHHRGGRPDRLEVRVVGAAHGLPVGRVEQVHARAHDVAQRRVELGQRDPRDLERAHRLVEDVGVAGAVGPHRPGPRHQHAVADPDRAREADRALERRVGRRPPALIRHRGTTSPSAPARTRCGRAWSPGTPRAPPGRARARAPTACSRRTAPRRCRSAGR